MNTESFLRSMFSSSLSTQQVNSLREVYKAYGHNKSLMRELITRDHRLASWNPQRRLNRNKRAM